MKILSLLSFFLLSAQLVAKDYVLEFSSYAEKEKALRENNKINSYYPIKLNHEIDHYAIFEGDINELKNYSLKNLFESKAVDLLTVKPGPDFKTWSHESLSSFQWGMKNGGHIIREDISDIKARVYTSKPEYDLNLLAAKSQSHLQKKEVVVAVIDSGLDLDHQEFAGLIYKNEAECIDGKLPPNPKEDKDENGFIGDCMGWDFTSEKKGHRTYDNLGHGTHVAGIITNSKNDKGIFGVSNKVKILPIKVTDSNKKVKNTITHRVGQAVLYAALRGVDVINLSLGWPASLNDDGLMKAFQFALDRDITIIAAAGNNSHNGPMFPCHMKGVICVTSMDADGALSSFSNHGMGVDFIAPGNQILSLYPNKLDSLYFPVQGYELLNGSSQAAPFISLMAALAKSENPHWDRKDIKKHLISGALTNTTHTSWDGKILYGLPKYKKAIESETAMLLPILKEIHFLSVNNDSMASFELSFENLGNEKGKEIFDLKITTPDDEEAIIKRQRITIEIGGKDEAKKLISIRLPESYDGAELSIEIRNKSQRWNGALFLNRELIEKDLTTYKVPKAITSLSSVKSYVDASPLYYSSNKKNILIFDPQAKERVFTLETVGEITSVRNIWRMDVNGDGKLDLVVRSINVIKKEGEEDDRFLLYALYDSTGKPLIGEKESFWKFRPSLVVLDTKNLNWIKHKHETLGSLRLPVFLGRGGVPEKQINPNPWNRLAGAAQHLYTFYPVKQEDGSYELETRILDDYKAWPLFEQEEWNSRGKLQWITFLRGNPHYHKEFTAYAALKDGFNETQYRIRVLENLKLSVEKISLPFSLLENQLRNSSSNDIDPYALSFEVFNEKSIVVRKLRHSGGEEFELQVADSSQFIGLVDVYEVLGMTKGLFITKRGVEEIAISSNASKPVSLWHYSFIPGEFFQQQFFTLKNRPGVLYLDNTAILGSTIQTLQSGEQGLHKRYQDHFSFDKECQGLNPVEIRGKYHLVLLCNQEQEKRLSFLELNL